MAWTILVTDDNAMIRNIVRLILESQGHSVIEVVNGHDSLSKANGHIESMTAMMPTL